MQNLDITNYATIIDENSPFKRCSTDCNLKYNYQSSNNFKACINDASTGFPFFPNIEITNQTLTNPQSLKTHINFNNVDYIFNKMYLTDGCYNLFTYNNNYNIGSVDTSMCACILMHQDITNKNNLLIYIPIIAVDNTREYKIGTARDIINTIITDVSGYTCESNSTFAIPKTFNLNDLIPSEIFYWTQISNINLVIFSGIDSIRIDNPTKLKMSSYFTRRISALTRGDQLNRNTLFKSTNPAINILSSEQDDIYIQCQPTDEEGTLLEQGIPKVPTSETRSPFDKIAADDFFKNNTVVSIIVGILLMIVLIKGAELLFKSGSRMFLDIL